MVGSDAVNSPEMPWRLAIAILRHPDPSADGDAPLTPDPATAKLVPDLRKKIICTTQLPSVLISSIFGPMTFPVTHALSSWFSATQLTSSPCRRMGTSYATRSLELSQILLLAALQAVGSKSAVLGIFISQE